MLSCEALKIPFRPFPVNIRQWIQSRRKRNREGFHRVNKSWTWRVSTLKISIKQSSTIWSHAFGFCSTFVALFRSNAFSMKCSQSFKFRNQLTRQILFFIKSFYRLWNIFLLKRKWTFCFKIIEFPIIFFCP